MKNYQTVGVDLHTLCLVYHEAGIKAMNRGVRVPGRAYEVLSEALSQIKSIPARETGYGYKVFAKNQHRKTVRAACNKRCAVAFRLYHAALALHGF